MSLVKSAGDKSFRERFPSMETLSTINSEIDLNVNLQSFIFFALLKLHDAQKTHITKPNSTLRIAITLFFTKIQIPKYLQNTSYKSIYFFYNTTNWRKRRTYVFYVQSLRNTRNFLKINILRFDFTNFLLHLPRQTNKNYYLNI